jgi:dTDP-4-dehydrorhamnose 3,5-epimerase
VRTASPIRQDTGIAGVELIELAPLDDARGRFVELCRHSWLDDDVPVQWNLITNLPNALRGMHWHDRHTDYLSVAAGELLVALVDLRRGSPSQDRVELHKLAESVPRTLVVPAGVGHGFYSPGRSVVLYAVTRYWDLDDEFGFHWADRRVGIPWPMTDPIVSERDAAMPPLVRARRRPLWSGDPLALREQVS